LSILTILPTDLVSLTLAGLGGLVAYLGVVELISRGEFLRSVRELAMLVGK